MGARQHTARARKARFGCSPTGRRRGRFGAPMLVMKFGGSSVADRRQITKVLGIVRGLAARKPVVVSSAHQGVTDALVRAAKEAAAGKLDVDVVIGKQRAVAEEVGCAPELLERMAAELSDLRRGVRLVRGPSPPSLADVPSLGERWSVRVIADFFRREGLAARAYDVWALGFVTDAEFGRAPPLPGFEERA